MFRHCAFPSLPLLVLAALTQAATSPKAGDKRTNPIDGAEMVYVPAGTFEMGGDHPYDGKPKHMQRVEGFWMYTKTVTNGQYRKFVQANAQWGAGKVSSNLADSSYLSHWTQSSKDASSANEYPVVYVSWHAARAYAEWAGGSLPTEAEWEYAAKGGKNFEYGTASGQISYGLANYYSGSTKPVGSYPPNLFGLCDMAGNVWQWCSSLPQPYPYAKNDGRENPNASGSRVVRGGSFNSAAAFLRSATRASDVPDGRYHYGGFRVVVLSGVR